jgi:nickel/cobalt exporter
MMAAFIIAIRGTVTQAVLLGLAATASHTAIVWIIALAGLHFGAQWNTEATEPYLQIVSAILILGVAVWMLWRTWQDQQAHKHHHHHGGEVRTIDTGKSVLTIEIFEDGVPPCWCVRSSDGRPLSTNTVTVETIRPDGTRQSFAFKAHDGYLQSIADIPEPHAFTARVSIVDGDHMANFDLEFSEHEHVETAGLVVGTQEFADAHERSHAEDIRRRFANQHVTTGQIVMFGLTGGLIPCPASIAILLLCLQLKQFTLGATLVLCFSIGLAVTMVSVGAAAALSVRHISKRWSGFDEAARRAPYLSGALIIAVGLYTGYLGWTQLLQHHS